MDNETESSTALLGSIFLDDCLKETIDNAIDNLTVAQCEIIKDGIEQHGEIGHYGRNFIVAAIRAELAK
ncbi:hypothetical protein LCGC14_1727780 [marine sediment metagenome]|uniref:Uncharacterized protein n=1 Tax=marine sediment metagenome TaxID=412755 RepID=A0A0F9KA50_9ZZZZ